MVVLVSFEVTDAMVVKLFASALFLRSMPLEERREPRYVPFYLAARAFRLIGVSREVIVSTASCGL